MPAHELADPSYETVHARLAYRRGAASDQACVDCGDPAEDWAYDHSAQNERHDPKGRPYSDDLSTYVALCRACHRKRDAKSTCRKGHILTEVNVYVRGGFRYCRDCRREYMREYRTRDTSNRGTKENGN